MTMTEAFQVQMDNPQRELQRLQVKNQRLWGDEQSAGVRKEMEDLRQRLFEVEERALGAEQEAEQWKAEVEQLIKGNLGNETGREGSQGGTHQTVGSQNYSGGAVITKKQ